MIHRLGNVNKSLAIEILAQRTFVTSVMTACTYTDVELYVRRCKNDKKRAQLPAVGIKYIQS